MDKKTVHSIRCKNENWEKIKNNAANSNMVIEDFLADCCIERKKNGSRRMKKGIGCVYVQLTQLCNDSPELKEKIGGCLCQLRDCL